MKPLEVLNLYSPHDGTLSALLETRAAVNGDKACLVFETERTHSWKNFVALVAGLSLFLSRNNVQKGDRVVVISPNSDLVVALFFAANDAGAIFVPINPDLTSDETMYVLRHADPEVVFVAREQREKILATKLISTDKVFEISEEMLKMSATSLQRKAMASDIGLILYTSGTTGFPKGVMHAQASTVMAGEAFVERMQLQPDERMLCILPFFHINALFYSMMGSFAAGATLIVARKFSASKFWSLVADTRATQVNIIAAIGNILAQRDRKEWRADHSLKKIYGAPVSATIEKIFKTDFKVPLVIEGYGMTEIPGAINNEIEGRQKIGAMGVAARHPNPNIPFTELKIVDDTGVVVAQGQTGELLVKTPLLMKGYYKDDTQTKDTFTSDGWFKTGDYVMQDSDGFFIFIARKKDIIRRRGENVSGAEVDRIVLACPGVAEAATIGVASPLGEEDILVAVVKREGETLEAPQIRAWCEQHLARIKWPRYVAIVNALPHTPTARVAKFKLRADKSLQAIATDFEE